MTVRTRSVAALWVWVFASTAFAAPAVAAAPKPAAPAKVEAELQSSLVKIQNACRKGGLKSLSRVFHDERKRILLRAESLGEKGIDSELERESARKVSDPRPLVSALTEIVPEKLPADHPMRNELMEQERELEKALSGSREAARNWALKARSLYVVDRPRTSEAILLCVEKAYRLKLED